MRDLLKNPALKYRRYDPEVKELYGDFGGSTCGAFFIPAGVSRNGYSAQDGGLAVIASSSDGWDHLSVSGDGRTPFWEEMMLVHRIFMEDWETAYQLHLPKEEHINCHPYTLHLWRPHWGSVPLPPREFV
jgi:hypothetical protein